MAVFQLWLLVALDNVFLDHTTSLARRHSVYASKVAGPAKAINWLEFLPVGVLEAKHATLPPGLTLSETQPVFNDAFIIWRTWVVFQRRKWALYLSLALCLSTFGWTLWHRRMFKVPHILALLVDSGAAYMTLQVREVAMLSSTHIPQFFPTIHAAR
ncbi:hypothetical protein DXG01_008173 [Tephrocybe rancida]|nr:hypothetical protein DXG01_008173 [Tephrocybe rancida]